METQKCPACGEELTADAKFCTECGREINFADDQKPAEQSTISCPYCGERIKAQAKKCRFCGEWLDESDTSDDIYNEQKDNYAEESEGRDSFLLAVLAAIWSCVCNLWDAFGETVISCAVLAAIAHFTMPSDEKMIAKAEKEMFAFMKKTGNNLLPGAGDVLSLAMLSDDTYNTVKKLILGDNRIVVKDHWLWKTVEIVNDKHPDGTRIGFGLFGVSFADVSASDISLSGLEKVFDMLLLL
ncbi:MAG: zinc ribbon domain-containing protein [Alistipes sp.]|nr:zinc ribbon domain-containing protein [Alistipes sp.]